MTLALIIETGAVPSLVTIPDHMQRAATPAVTQMRMLPPSPDALDAAPQFETVEVTPAVAAETDAEFRARMIAAHVPNGAQHIVTTTDQLPPVAPELWVVDWVAKTVGVNGGAALDAAKAKAHDAIAAFARSVRHQFAETDDPIRLAAWAVKADIARRVAAGTASPFDVQILAAECQTRGKGETPEQLAARVLYWANADSLAAAMADGMQKQAEAAIDACVAVAQIEPTLDAIKAQAGGMVAQMLASRTGPEGQG